MNMLRMKSVLEKTGYRTHTSIYQLISVGLFPKGVQLAARSVAWPDNEVEAINAARVAGKTEEEIRALVNRLHQQRQEIAT